MENTIRVLKVEPNRRYVDDIICGPFDSVKRRNPGVNEGCKTRVENSAG